VDENDRYIDMGSADIQRNVLLEDFTGQECVNCPRAHKVMEDIEALYGEHVIAVSVHGGQFGIPVSDSYVPYYVGLASPEGIEYNKAKGLDSWPAGEINRQGKTTEYDKWSDAVRTWISKPAQASIEIEATLKGSDIEIATSVVADCDYAGHLQVWIVENGIVAIQKDGDEYVMDYVHNNVLRAAVNGLWGEPVTCRKGVRMDFSHRIALRNSNTEVWNPDNLGVVVFLYNDSGVAQAMRVKVQQPTTT